MDPYAFDAAWEKERDRLRAPEAAFDPATTRRLADLGVGWRCLEVGCGAGGVALWLAGQVGPAGRVLVREEIVNGRVRRSYGLTPPGAGALRAEAARMAEAARLVTDRGRGLKACGPTRKTSPA